MKLIDGWNEGSNVVFLYKTNDGIKKRKIIEDFDWYFYIKKTDYDKKPTSFWLSLMKKNGRYIQKIVPEGGYYRVYVNNNNIHFKSPNSDDKIKLLDLLKDEGIQTCDGDIPSYKRCMIDTENLEIDTDLKILFFDIETDDRSGEIVVGREKILSFAAYDTDGREYFICEDEEEETLLKIKKLLLEFDVICGWNSKNFDLPYLKERFMKNNIVFDWHYIIHVDFMYRFMRLFGYMSGEMSFTLEDVSQHFLKEGKIKLDKGIYELYENDREMLKKYNLRDSELLYKMDKKLDIINLMSLTCQVCKTFLSRYTTSELLDNYILRNSKDFKFPSINYDKMEYSDYVGAFVLDPDTGFYNDVYCFDFKSLYPSIIKTWNISLDTLTNDKKDAIKAVNDLYYRKETGVIPKIIETMLSERKKYKKLLNETVKDTAEYRSANIHQQAFKDLANSLYGILGFRHGRYFNAEVAESITKAGQYLLKSSKIWFENNRDAKVIYGDTDSLFVVFKKEYSHEEMEKMPTELNQYIEKTIKNDFNIVKSHIELNYEKHFKTLVLVDKKRYSGLLCELDGKKTDYIFTKGLEIVRKDTIDYAKNLQKELFDLVLRKCIPDVEIKSWVIGKKSDYMNSVLSIEDLKIKIRITKEPDSYKSNSLHVKLAKKLREMNREFYIGMEVPFIVTSSNPNLDGVYYKDFDGSYDKRYYWNKRIFPVLERILSTAYKNIDWSSQYINSMDIDKLSGQKMLGDY